LLFKYAPDPKLRGKWDPDPQKIVSDPQHCYFVFALMLALFETMKDHMFLVKKIFLY
jgi:hypothetical protein